MTELVWRVIRHGELPENEKKRVAALKDQHWPHGEASQLRWLADNLRDDDLHLLGDTPDGTLAAYLTLVNVAVTFDDLPTRALGVGCVCVNKRLEHTGYGKRLLARANAYIDENGRQGILLCKDTLTPFYRKCGWDVLQTRSAFVKGERYGHFVMVYPRMPQNTYQTVSCDRNF